jgi:uncharacterized protein involved in type VI secretion and phage assembly
MGFTIYDSGKKEKKDQKAETSIAAGVVVNSCDVLNQGKVLVRIPSLGQEVWARISAPGAGRNGGFFANPEADDEVLVALSGNDPADAYIINGLWNTRDTPPVETNVQAQYKRVLKTGMQGAVGHTVEFDHGLDQSITITTATKQKLVMDLEKIEISTTLGTLKISLDLKTQTLSIQAPKIVIGGEKTAQLSLQAKKIEIGGLTTVKTSVNGKMVTIN